MTSANSAFDFAPLLAPGLPPPAIKWNGFPKYNFVGGHNDADHVPLDALVETANDVLRREGRTLATYGLNSGPLGYSGCVNSRRKNSNGPRASRAMPAKS